VSYEWLDSFIEGNSLVFFPNYEWWEAMLIKMQLQTGFFLNH